jgi:hypothetical protein
MFKDSQPSDELMKDLQNNTGVLKDLLRDFAITTQLFWLRLQIRCFFELRQTQKKGFKDFVSGFKIEEVIILPI